MVKVTVGGSLDIHKIHRLVRSDEILVGYPDGITHPGSTYLRHKISPKTGRKLKGKERAGGGGGTIANADLAEDLHDGTAKIPARPFLMQGLGSEMTAIKKAIKECYEQRAKGLEGNLDKIGALAVGAVQKFVRGDYYRGAIPNAPSTIQHKGSDKPLIDTSFMINSTTWVTRNRQKMPDRRAHVKVTSSGTVEGPMGGIPTSVTP